MAGWIKMPPGMEVDLDPGHTVLDGDPALPQKGHSPSNFRPTSVVAKRLDGSRCHLVQRWASAQATVLDGDPALISERGTAASPTFRPMSVVGKQLDGSR